MIIYIKIYIILEGCGMDNITPNYGLPEEIFHPDKFPHYNFKYEIVEDNPRLGLRKGDIVRFSHSPIFPKEIRGEMGVVLERFKLVKDKGYHTFQDYGAIVMIITGEMKGKIRKYFSDYGLSGSLKFP